MTGLVTSSYSLVSRALPQPSPDNVEREQRTSRYGGIYVYNVVPTKHILADEGSYFVAADTAGRATATAPTTFSDTAPLLTIFNTDSLGNPSSKRIYLDYIRGFLTAAGTTATAMQIEIKLDSTNRGQSGGTTLTSLNVNMDVSQKNSIGIVTVLPTTTATPLTSRTVVNQSVVATTQTTTMTATTEWTAFFGGVNVKFAHPVATVGFNANSFPPIVIGPGQICVVNFLITGQAAASSWAMECGWWER